MAPVIYKTRCRRCGKYSVMKRGFSCCMSCWEKGNGKYQGDDRSKYV